MPRLPAEDKDNPEWTAEDFARARPASELPGDLLTAFPNTARAVRQDGLTQKSSRLAIWNQGAGASLRSIAA